jgi:hypothetical protein
VGGGRRQAVSGRACRPGPPDLGGFLNGVEADLFLEKKAGIPDFNNQGAVQAFLAGPLTQRFDQLTEMLNLLNGAVPQPAQTAVTQAVNALPYQPATAKVEVASFIDAMDEAEGAATDAMQAQVQSTMLFGTEFSFTVPDIHGLDVETNDGTGRRSTRLGHGVLRVSG